MSEQEAALTVEDAWRAKRTVVVDRSIDDAFEHVAEVQGKPRRRVKVEAKDGRVVGEIGIADVTAGLLKRADIEIEVVPGRKPKFRKCRDCKLPFELGWRQHRAALCKACRVKQDLCAGCQAPLPKSNRSKRVLQPRPWFGRECGCSTKSVNQTISSSARVSAGRKANAKRTKEERAAAAQKGVSASASARLAQKHCRAGHTYTPSDLLRRGKGKRVCGACDRQRKERQYLRDKEGRSAKATR